VKPDGKFTFLFVKIWFSTVAPTLPLDGVGGKGVPPRHPFRPDTARKEGFTWSLKIPVRNPVRGHPVKPDGKFTFLFVKIWFSTV
jgi:hypothetical protein